MMRVSTALIVGWLLASGAHGQDDAAKEQKRLQGTWNLVTVEFEGKPVNFFEGARAVVAGDKVTLTFAKGGKIVRTFKDYTDTTPRCVDFLPESGTGDGSEGIYELKENRLQLLVNVRDGGKERPVSFADKSKRGHVYYLVERAK
jgi:uncharacterized protein (TIGR03067 family)